MQLLQLDARVAVEAGLEMGNEKDELRPELHAAGPTGPEELGVSEGRGLLAGHVGSTPRSIR